MFTLRGTARSLLTPFQLTRDQEVEVDVTKVDQDRINQFGRLNNKMHELEDEKKTLEVIISTLYTSCLTTSAE